MNRKKYFVFLAIAFTWLLNPSLVLSFVQSTENPSGTIVFLHLDESEFPIDLKINEVGSDNLNFQQTRNALVTSIGRWVNISTSKINFTNSNTTLNGIGLDGNFLIVFNETSDLGTSVIASTGIFYNINTGEIVDADIEFNGNNFNFNADGTNSGNTIDVESVAVHELGHLLGLDHATIGTDVAGINIPEDTRPTMYPFAFSSGTKGRSLEKDDIAGASFIYPESIFYTNFAGIKGNITRNNGSSIFGANLVAINISNNATISSLSGYSTGIGGKGEYLIVGLDPGNYTVTLEPLPDSSSDTDESNLGGIFSNFDTGFSSEFYNNKLNFIDGIRVSINAGENVTGINFVIGNVAPTVLNLTINSTDAFNRTNGSLIGLFVFNDSDFSDINAANETRWYTNSLEVVSLRNLTSISFGNTTKLENWTFSIRVFDGTAFSNFVNATITIKNAEPVINTSFPESQIVSVYEPNNISFYINSTYDIDNDGLTIRWYRNGSLAQSGPSFNFTGNFSSSGFYNITAEVSDGNAAAFKSWNLTINNTNTAVNLTSFFPSEAALIISEPNNQSFNITYNDSDNGDIITILWYQNSTLRATNSSFNFTGNFSSAGFYNITVIISDGTNSTYQSWNLTVNNTCDTPFEISNITRNVTYCANQVFNFSQGIIIGADNVVLDCNGSVLNGDTNTGTGISNTEKDNTTIMNCAIKQYMYGINLSSSNKINVWSNNITDASFSVYVTDTNNSNLFDNILENYDGEYSGYGIHLYNSNFNVINKNILNKTINDGSFGGGANTQCVINAYNTAIFAYASNFNNITSNSIASNRHGVFISCSSNNNIISNNITHKFVNGGPTIFGIVISSSNRTSIKNNSLSINMSNDYSISIDYPNFINKSFNTTIINNSVRAAQYLIYNSNNNNLIAEFNYWGNINHNQIDEKIYDNSNDSSLGIVDFDPWYLDTDYTSDSDSDNDGFSNSSLGGSDCNDANNSVYPNATELRNYADDNCDNITDDGFALGNSSDINSAIPGLNITINQSENLSKSFNEVQNIAIKNATHNLIEFLFNFSGHALNLSNITIEKQNGSSTQGELLIKGIRMPEKITKTAYVDNIGFFHGVCIRDEEIESINNISSNCNGHYQTFLSCPGSKGQYNCTINGTRWKIEGLNHSGIQQQNDTLPPLVTSITTANSGTSTVTVNLSVTTDENATCRFSTSNITYENMSLMANTNSTINSNSISYTSDTSGNYFVRCNDTYGNVMSLSNFTAFNADVQESSGGSSPSGGSSGGGGGGGGSGGGGAFFVCNMDWQCSEWSSCTNGLQSRQCNFVKVAQHAQDTPCQTLENPPITSQKCEIAKQAASIQALQANCSDGAKNQDEEGIDCGGACKPCEAAKNLKVQAVKEMQELNQTTGFAVKDLVGRVNFNFTAIAILVLAVSAAFFGLKFYNFHRKV